MKRRSLLLFSAACCAAGAAAAAEITVSGAASLGPALRELIPLYEAAAPGERVRLNLGASGALLQQIAAGAPVQVFASADEQTMEQAVARRLVRAADRRVLVTNRLVVAVPAGGAAAPPSTLADVAAMGRVAIGLPASVPAGRYARAALEAAGLWTRIEPRLVGAQNVRQALDYIARGEVDAGFVYASDLAVAGGRARIAFEVPTPIPIRYPVAALAGAPPAARRFVDFLLSPAARAVFERHGFGLPA
jgi:molybdate transport system substrate-binding protein